MKFKTLIIGFIIIGVIEFLEIISEQTGRFLAIALLVYSFVAYIDERFNTIDDKLNQIKERLGLSDGSDY